MDDYSSYLAYFRIELAKLGTLTRETVRTFIEQDLFARTLAKANPDAIEIVVRELEASLDITQAVGSIIQADYRPWLNGRKELIDFYYWRRLQQYFLTQNVLPPHVVATLDRVTDEVLDYSGDPSVDDGWKRRGMVLGHVQSGKTTNYSALICKAADAGYRVIILLAGITNSLREQTQERIDETFIGCKSLFSRAAVKQDLSIVQFATPKRFPAYGTSRENDFSKKAAKTYGVTIEALREPIIFVTKKNKATLEALREWLKEQNPAERIEAPLLLIDDEADNASINTSADPNATTAINAAIRSILGLFSRSSYVGYTATPFANIFIDPDSDSAMVADDLFPRHFIKALDPPSNYVGAERLFTDDSDLQAGMIREVSDYASILPLNHKRNLAIDSLPESLKTAIRVFVLSRAIRIIRGQEKKHASMMINASRFNDVQERIQGLVYAYLQEIKQAIEMSVGLPDPWAADPMMVVLRETWEEEFRESGADLGSVAACLRKAVATVEVRTINMKRKDVLNYSRHAEDGLHVIAIGGLALSRGLTLEGLTVSYILRNASAADTLMQMARWFGYRPGYEDLCRLYLPPASRAHYEFITSAMNELRDEIKLMERRGASPEEFGLKVRHSSAAIRITAANKMRSAQKMTVAQDYSNEHVEGYALVNDPGIAVANRELALGFLDHLGQPDYLRDSRHPVWESVDGSAVRGLVAAFQFHPMHSDLGPISSTGDSLFLDYFGDRISSELSKWDVALVLREKWGDGPFVPSELVTRSTILRRRTGGVVQGLGNELYKVTAKNRVSNPGDVALMLAPERRASLQDGEEKKDRLCCALLTRPALLIHLFTGPQDTPGSRLPDPVVTLSFAMPETRVPPVERTYHANKVYVRQLEQAMAEEEEDDRLPENGD
jgi:hypothetical protein